MVFATVPRKETVFAMRLILQEREKAVRQVRVSGVAEVLGSAAKKEKSKTAATAVKVDQTRTFVRF